MFVFSFFELFIHASLNLFLKSMHLILLCMDQLCLSSHNFLVTLL